MADPLLDSILNGKALQTSSDPALDAMLHGSPRASTGDPALDAALGNARAAGTGDPALDQALGAKPKAVSDTQPLPSRVWETAKGAGRSVIDLLSRPMYAAAGAAEELFSNQGGGPAAVPARVGAELFSGLPGVEGQKRNFSQVMERAGVGELGHLSDVLPFLYNETGEGPALQRGGWADPSGRGAVGLAADIGLDPTTYLTAGGAVTRRFVTKGGVRYLSPAGQDVLKGLTKELAPSYSLVLQADNDILRQTGMRQISETLRDQMEKRIAQDPALLDKTGIKWFGHEIVSRQALEGLSAKTQEIVLSLPGGDRAARVAAGFRDGMRRLFDPYAEVAGLDEFARDGVKNTVRDFHNSMTASTTKDFSDWAPIEAEERKLAAKYGKGDEGIQILGKKFADWREGTGQPELTEAEKVLFEKVGANYDARGLTLVNNGILTGEQWDKYQGRYLFHDYKNKDVLSETVAQARHFGLTSPANFTAEREFETLADAVQISKGLRAEGLASRLRGGTHAVYGELVPEYGISKNLATHIEKSNRALWQAKLFDELRTKYGIEAGAYDASRVYDLQTPAQVASKDRLFIQGFVDQHKTLVSLADAAGIEKSSANTIELNLAQKNLAAAWQEWQAVKYAEGLASTNYSRNQVDIFNERLNTARSLLATATKDAARTRGVLDQPEKWAAVANSAKSLLPKLSPDGQKELARTLVSMAHSPGQVFRIRAALGDDLMPEIKALRAGDIEPFFLRHGLPEDKARLVPVKGGLWGETEHLIPQAIANMVDQMPRDMVMSAAVRAHIGWLVKGYDKYNNLFKGLTYPFWPAGAVRDAYNNLQHSFLSLGIGGFARPGVAADIMRSDWKTLASDAGRKITIGNHTFSAGEWNKITQDLRVVDPTASSFVQFTGEQGAERASFYAKARSLRGNVDNLTRTQLFVNGVGQGMSLEDAARMVHEFHYNYSELSSFDRDVLRRLFPFIVFTRKTIGLYGDQIVKQPGRFVNLAKPFMGREDENQQMTSWEGEGFKLRLDRNGKNVTMLNGVDLPVRSLDMLWQGAPGKTIEGLVASASPAIKVPYEFISERDPFRGQPFGRSDRPTLGRAIEHIPWVRDFLGFKKEVDAAGRPHYTMRDDRVQPLIEAAAVSRFFSTPDRAFREQLRQPNAPARWLDFLTGLRFKTLNLDDEQKKKRDAAIRAAEEEQIKQGAKREFRKIYTPKAAAR